jgi:hypothetical protein
MLLLILGKLLVYHETFSLFVGPKILQSLLTVNRIQEARPRVHEWVKRMVRGSAGEPSHQALSARETPAVLARKSPVMVNRPGRRICCATSTTMSALIVAR